MHIYLTTLLLYASLQNGYKVQGNIDKAHDGKYMPAHQELYILKSLQARSTKNGGIYLQMQDGEKIPVSRDKKDWVKKEMLG